MSFRIKLSSRAYDMESIIWLVAGTQGFIWTLIFRYEAGEENRKKDSLIRMFKRPVCRAWTEPLTGRRFYHISALTESDMLDALIANSTFAKTTQEDMDAKQ